MQYLEALEWHLQSSYVNWGFTFRRLCHLLHLPLPIMGLLDREWRKPRRTCWIISMADKACGPDCVAEGCGCAFCTAARCCRWRTGVHVVQGDGCWRMLCSYSNVWRGMERVKASCCPYSVDSRLFDLENRLSHFSLEVRLDRGSSAKLL